MISPGAILPESKISLLHLVEAIAILDTHSPVGRNTRVNCAYCRYKAENTRKNINRGHSKLENEKMLSSRKAVREYEANMEKARG